MSVVWKGRGNWRIRERARCKLLLRYKPRDAESKEGRARNMLLCDLMIDALMDGFGVYRLGQWIDDVVNGGLELGCFRMCAGDFGLVF